MGKTYKKYGNRHDDEFPSGRSGKHARHANGKKTGGMRTINSYVEEDYDFSDDTPFDDDIELQDEITINIRKHNNTFLYKGNTMVNQPDEANNLESTENVEVDTPKSNDERESPCKDKIAVQDAISIQLIKTQ